MTSVLEHLALVPGIEVVVTGSSGEGASAVAGHRLEPNLWELVAGGSSSAELRIQLDRCGTWITMSTSEHRPVVVRRAGWVELRGQDAPDPLARWDRVGLGPEDALVVPVHRGPLDADAVLTTLLAHTGAPASELAERLLHETGPLTYVIIRVPAFDPAEGPQRACEATGLPPETFAAPLHQPGSPEAELWRQRPAPPMEARIRLEPTTASVFAARDLLCRLLLSWRMPEQLDGVLELLTAELLTAAVAIARAPIETVIRHDGDALRVEVRPPDPAVAAPIEPTAPADGDSGSWLVTSLADRWGRNLHRGAQCTWFELDIDGASTADATVIYAHSILSVARDIDTRARELVTEHVESSPTGRAEALAVLTDRCRFISDMLRDLAQGRTSGR